MKFSLNYSGNFNVLNRCINIIRDFFSVSRQEAKGVVLLMALSVLVLLIPRMVGKDAEITYDTRPFLDSLYLILSQKAQVEEKLRSKKKFSNFNFKGFPFNPNSISREDFIRMGLKPSLVNTILNYRSSGGVFKTRNDLKKIYGLNEGLFAKMKPFILLPDSSVKQYVNTGKVLVKKLWVPLNLNEADTIQLKKIYGIGSVLANRIIRYRELLGGFHEIKQLREVYGLTDSVIIKIEEKFFIEKDPDLKSLFVNTMEVDLLGKHPYISYSLARQIVNYREVHGRFNSDTSLMQLHTVTDSLFQKLKPYIRN